VTTGAPDGSDTVHVQVAARPDGAVAVTVAGALDLATAERLDSALTAARHAPLIVDLTEVDHFGSAAVRVLYRHADRGMELLVPADGIICEILTITRLADRVRVRPI